MLKMTINAQVFMWGINDHVDEIHTYRICNENCLYVKFIIVLTFEDPFEYICIMFSAPCFTLSSISNCFCKAINLLLLVAQRGSLLGVSGVLGQSVNSILNCLPGPIAIKQCKLKMFKTQN